MKKSHGNVIKILNKKYLWKIEEGRENICERELNIKNGEIMFNYFNITSILINQN